MTRAGDSVRRAGSPLTRFVIRVLVWLPVMFALWYLAAPVLMWPVALLVQAIADGSLADLVARVDQTMGTLTFTTTLRPGQALARGQVAVDVNLLLYSFGMPLLAALTVAARERTWKRKLLVGYLAMLPFVAFGAFADFLKNIAITASPPVAAQAGFSSAQRELIAFAFQFGSLILPPVVPAVLWVVMHRGFLERLRSRA
jgi:hypothetical protein